MKNNSLLCSNALHCNGNHEAPPQILAGGRASINIISRFYLETRGKYNFVGNYNPKYTVSHNTKSDRNSYSSKHEQQRADVQI